MWVTGPRTARDAPIFGRTRRSVNAVLVPPAAGWKNHVFDPSSFWSDAAVTELLYDTDAYLRDFEARVVGVEGSSVTLDRTAFYPGGGGQPPDKGALIHSGNVLAVTEARKRDGEVWHSLIGQAPRAGSRVLGHIDWARRHALMRTHTALHILSAVVWRDYRKQVTGGDMKPLAGRLDFEFEGLNLEIANAIESAINAEVAAGREIRVAILPREEAFEIPDLIRTKVNLLPEGIPFVRTVEIVGLDLQADGGTHVANTREIGPVKLVGHESKGRINKRLRIELEAEAPAAPRAPAAPAR
jgi:misacylated tRNA(Ala) deacylase